MSAKSRAELKNYFKKGEIPREQDFHDLIDSMINERDDQISRTEDVGFHIQSGKNGGRLFSFTDRKGGQHPDWHIRLDEEEKGGLSIGEGDKGYLFLQRGGNVGVGVEQPLHELDVNGMVGMHGRVGYYRFGELPADGKWHDVINELDKPVAFELIASAGEKGAHALTHATAVCTYGKSKGGITKTQNYFGRSHNKIDVRWNGEYFNFALQVRTHRSYSPGVKIKFNLMKIWA